MDYICILEALQEIPFCVGKKLLIAFLQGKNENSIEKNKLNLKKSFGSLAYEKDELNVLIDNLIMNNLIKTVSLNTNKFWKVLELTNKGITEIENPTLYKRKLTFNFKQKETKINNYDKEVFKSFSNFLMSYNDAQKKSIISNKKEILCIAGAGSGKTTVLTKRVEFLIKYCGINPSEILAITFTRKAREEMVKRLSHKQKLNGIKIETFNSFCEKILKSNSHLIYDKETRVLNYGDKFKILNKALFSLNTNVSKAINNYFTPAQQRNKTSEQLANIFMNDCFFVRDYLKFKNRIFDEAILEDKKNELSAKIFFGVCNYIEAYLKKNGLRDFSDQLLDTITFFEKNNLAIPKFKHILVDEYQDVNSTQIKLLDLLASENIFCVGDPRQSIFGWRGSDVKYILNFEEKYPQCEIITLIKNYRSAKSIVKLINNSIRRMGLSDLEGVLDNDANVKLLNFSSELMEFEFIIQSILTSKIQREEIFVLARTNRQLQELSAVLKKRNIKHIVRSNEFGSGVVGKKDVITLATIHAIKGLEAETVFVIGCTMNNFPCKGSDHPIIEMIKIDEYDKEEEERRLFYVAMSRAKTNLYLTYTGSKPTYFITNEMLDLLKQTKETKETLSLSKTKINQNNGGDLFSKLKTWRLEICRKLNVPAYMVLNNQTLEDITQKMPMTMMDLEQIHGLGPVKIMKYGQEILNLVCG